MRCGIKHSFPVIDAGARIRFGLAGHALIGHEMGSGGLIEREE